MLPFLIFLSLSLCVLSSAELPVINPSLIFRINSMQSTWKAGFNLRSAVHGITQSQARALCGVREGGPELPRKTFGATQRQAVPSSFNSITKWPNCASMKVIRDQSECGSCWAFGAVEAMSDRSCIFLNKQLSLSAAGMAFCCTDCGYGCEGGFPSAAWSYYNTTGVVEEGCWPYPFPSCDHHMPHSKNPCPSQMYPTPECASGCVPTWKGPAWGSDLHFGTAYSLSGEDDMKQELFANGPVEATFSVYEDFLTYTSGVYQHVTGSYLGGHAIKIMGWGSENNVPYWLVANSWNPHWGEKGFQNIKQREQVVGVYYLNS